MYYAGLMDVLRECEKVPCTFAVWQYRNARAGGPHTHDFHELFWVEGGQGVHTINGEPRTLSPGYLILVRDHDYHNFSVQKPGQTLQFINFAFPVKLWKRIKKAHFPDKKVFFDLLDFHEREYQLPPAAVMKLKVLCEDLTRGHLDALTAESFLLAVLTLLRNQTPGENSTNGVPGWLARTVERIRIYPNFTGGTQAMARIAGCSPEHLARSVRKYLHTSPHDLVNEARLSYSTVMLTSTGYSIVDIALECGFPNLGHYYDLFRSRFQMTPSEYRSRHSTKINARVQDGSHLFGA